MSHIQISGSVYPWAVMRRICKTTPNEADRAVSRKKKEEENHAISAETTFTNDINDAETSLYNTVISKRLITLIKKKVSPTMQSSDHV